MAIHSGVALRCTAKVEQAKIRQMFVVYVIYNELVSRTYTGQTENLQLRLEQHNNHFYKSYTARFPGKWVLIYSESVATRPEALKREKQLKSGNGREFVRTLVNKYTSGSIPE